MTASFACSERRFGEIASDWGYDARVQAAPATDMGAGQQVLAEGRILTARSSCGLRLCASDLRGTRHQVRSATLNRSLLIYLMAEGPPLMWDEQVGSRAGYAHAAVLAVGNRAQLTERHEAGQRSRCVVVQATPQELDDAELAGLVEDSLRQPQAASLNGLQRLGMVCAEMLADETPDSLARLWLESCALDMLARGLRQLRPATRPSRLSAQDRLRMQRVCDRLQADPGYPHQLAELAREAGVSASSLKEKFPLLTGCSVFDYLRQLRLARARQGMREAGWSVKQAAYYAGYRHPSNFTTAYRRHFGVAPTNE